ncbi:20528_t:CDS:2, partial [Cetraspora pellucida]
PYQKEIYVNEHKQDNVIAYQKKFLKEMKGLKHQMARDKAIYIFEVKFSNAMAMFAFDNSTNHKAYAKDVLITTKMNLKPSRNQLIMQLTTFVKADEQLNT